METETAGDGAGNTVGMQHLQNKIPVLSGFLTQDSFRQGSDLKL